MSSPCHWILSAVHFTGSGAPLAFVGGKDGQWSRTAWENSVDTACAVIYCFQKRRKGGDCEVFAPELRADSRRADYLYGRLLAVADFIEEKAMEKGRDYPTNAIRLMHKYVQYPFETWPRLYEKLIPSFKKLGEDSRLYQKILEEIEQLFSGEDRYKRGELSWEFLQGFSSQRQNLFQKWEPDQGEADEKKEGEESELYEQPNDAPNCTDVCWRLQMPQSRRPVMGSGLA